jgi:hypothetical protein
MVEGGGFEPPKAEPADLQSAPFGHSGTPPKNQRGGILLICLFSVNQYPPIFKKKSIFCQKSLYILGCQSNLIVITHLNRCLKHV